jgi:hypothetical protein
MIEIIILFVGVYTLKPFALSFGELPWQDGLTSGNSGVSRNAMEMAP